MVRLTEVKTRIFFLVFLCILSSCVVPPDVEDPLVLDPEEFALVSMLKRGKDYALSGQMDQAEHEFRKVMVMAPNMGSAYNDLGFVLKSQGRYDEAETMLRRALELSPDNSIARDNLARNYYIAGKVEQAAAEYDELLSWANKTDFAELNTGEREQFTAKDLIAVYRNLSILHYVLGDLDESRCYSRLALAYSGSLREIGRHVRLLLSLNQVNAALHTLKTAIAAQPGGISSKLLLDYGVALYAKGDYNLSRQALRRVLAQPSSDFEDRLSARLLLLSLSVREDDREESLDLFEAVLDEEATVCSDDVVESQSYWPFELAEDVRTALVELCSNED